MKFVPFIKTIKQKIVNKIEISSKFFNKKLILSILTSETKVPLSIINRNVKII